MARNPGYLVRFTDSDGVRHNGRTYNNLPPINGKLVVFYLDENYKPVYELDKDGKKVHKKRLFHPDRCAVCGMVD